MLHLYWQSISNECLWCEDNSGKDISKIYDKSVFYLNSVDEYLYFVVPSENNSICRIKKDGTEFEKIYDSFCYELTYYDGWLYFSSNWGGEEFHVCRMRTDGSDYKMLRRGECYDLCVVNNRIIFSTDMELRRLHSIDFNGDNEVILLNSYARFTNYYDEKLFFVNSEGMLCSCNLDGSNLTVLYNSTSYSFLTLLPQKIFCCDANKNNQLVVLGMQIWLRLYRIIIFVRLRS